MILPVNGVTPFICCILYVVLFVCLSCCREEKGVAAGEFVPPMDPRGTQAQVKGL